MIPPATDWLYDEGEAWGIPYGVDAQLTHVRQDIFDAAGVEFPDTWEAFAEAVKELQTPPAVYGWGMPLGNDGDCNISFTPILWGYGGKLQNDDGTLAFPSDAMLNAIAFIRKSYIDDRIIPPGAVGWTGAGNNTAYQSRQLVATYNSLSIYAWTTQNDPELEAMTAIYAVPGGPAGRFDGTQGWALTVFAASQYQDAAKDALAYFFDPDRYFEFIQLGQGRTMPIYRDQLFSDFFLEHPVYSRVPEALMTARSRSFSGPFSPAMSEFENTFVLPQTLQEVCIYGKDAEQAMNEMYDKALTIWQTHGYA
jgi:multiple sugar transport system substrate-binding protein